MNPHGQPPSPDLTQSVPRQRVTRGLFYLNLLWTTAAYSQRSLMSLGPVLDYSTSFSPIGIAQGQFAIAGGAQIVAISSESPHTSFYKLTPSGLALVHAMDCAHPPAFVTGADLYGDGNSECVTISEDGMSVSIMTSLNGAVVEKKIDLKVPSQRAVVADVNNDKRKDILLFGKKRQGMSVLYGKGGGTFVEGPLLFPDISVSDAKAADLNGDGITDIVLLNWLANQLSIAYGIGRGVFSEQATLDLPAEPSEIAISPVTKYRTMRFAITMPEQNSIGIVKGDATGDFALTGTINCGGAPSGVKFSNFNDDSFSDIVTSTSKGVLVCHGSSPTEFAEPTVFGIGHSIVGFATADLDSDGKTDLVVADQLSRRIVVLGNASSSGSFPWPSRYAVGGDPAGLCVGDFNGDGILDIAVANNGSASLSVLFGRRQALFEGQQCVTVSEGPRFIKESTLGGESQHVFVTSHPNTERISVIRLAAKVNESRTFSIPSGANPFVLFAGEDSSTHLLRILVRHNGEQNRSTTLSLFEQIGGGQFLERSVRPSLPSKILCLTVDSLRRSGPYDLVFATHDNATQTTMISIGLGDGAFDFKEVRPLIAYKDSGVTTRSLFIGHVNGDAFKDVVVYLGPPKNSLGIAYGRGDGTVKDSLVWVRGVHLLDDDVLLFRDVDGDTERDIVYLDSVTNSVMAVYGRKDGTFHVPKSVYPAKGVTSIRVERMRNTSSQDLIVSHAGSGTVSVIFDAFKR